MVKLRQGIVSFCGHFEESDDELGDLVSGNVRLHRYLSKNSSCY